jgi:hypothetical protein
MVALDHFLINYLEFFYLYNHVLGEFGKFYCIFASVYSSIFIMSYFTV